MDSKTISIKAYSKKRIEKNGRTFKMGDKQSITKGRLEECSYFKRKDDTRQNKEIVEKCMKRSLYD